MGEGLIQVFSAMQHSHDLVALRHVGVIVVVLLSVLSLCLCMLCLRVCR